MSPTPIYHTLLADQPPTVRRLVQNGVHKASQRRREAEALELLRAKLMGEVD